MSDFLTKLQKGHAKGADGPAKSEGPAPIKPVPVTTEKSQEPGKRYGI